MRAELVSALCQLPQRGIILVVGFDRDAVRRLQWIMSALVATAVALLGCIAWLVGIMVIDAKGRVEGFNRGAQTAISRGIPRLSVLVARWSGAVCQ
jgi:hypothetical protein